ncbi:hypothetical protein SAMN04515647_1624 [Cohaesibacter sp. ES.047]|uniref:hypothetical protein n=1 Tax=Cohaesibacter sp. ES.047 TaxID=1798205 RepID=UPI000BB85652|nr:hypothetical protein [Cohaesibacter sp. ES.047]SNY91402.1 hypothetical protein SAMN04515647_1624 [Cohaesibacter sp. ES.047]
MVVLINDDRVIQHVWKHKTIKDLVEILNGTEGFSKENLLEMDGVPGQIVNEDGSLRNPAPGPVRLAPITRKQLIDVLINHELDETVEPALEAIADGKERKKALNAWRNASIYKPDHDLIGHMKAALDLTEDQFAAMWREAMVLE